MKQVITLEETLDKVHIVPFKYKHLTHLVEMHKQQDYEGLDEMTMQHLPKIGYIAYLDKHPIAAGFLRKVEGGLVAQMDNLVSNPQFGSIIRHKAISLVVDQLILDAKSLKLKGIYAFSTEDAVVKRATSIGFISLNHTVLGLKL